MSTKSTKHLPKFYLHFTYKYQQCNLRNFWVDKSDSKPLLPSQKTLDPRKMIMAVMIFLKQLKSMVLILMILILIIFMIVLEMVLMILLLVILMVIMMVMMMVMSVAKCSHNTLLKTTYTVIANTDRNNFEDSYKLAQNQQPAP